MNQTKGGKALQFFKAHLKAGGLVRYATLTSFLHLSKFRAFTKIPLVGGIIKLPSLLLTAYEVEVDHGIGIEDNRAPTPIPLPRTSLLGQNQIYDYIIIGSGPGAATAFSKISQDASVLIIEKGDLPKTPVSLHHSLKHVVNDFAQAGQEIIFSKGFPQFAQGSVVGGGSEVNAGLYHPLPASNLSSYLDATRIDQSTWLQHEINIANFLKIEKMKVDENDSLIARGAREIELQYGNIPRWRKYNSDASFAHYGMIELKWKYIQDRENTTFLKNSKVIAINPKKDTLTEVVLQEANEEQKSFLGKNIYVAGGAIETPYLLAKSGLISWLDTRFQWHPMYRAIVQTGESDLGFGDIDPFQSWTDDYSLKFGSAVSTPGLLSLGLARSVSKQESQSLRSYYFSFVSSGRGGLVPRTRIPWYLNSDDDKSLKKGGGELLSRLILAGGGKFANPQTPISDKPSTVHIFGTLPIQSEVYLPGTLRLRKFPNIQVCDASLLPHGPGVNPQGVVMTVVSALIQP